MKAEERKELETNALANQLAHTADILKTHGATLRWLGGTTLAVAGIAVLAWYFLGGVSTSQSRLWTQYSGADTVAGFEKLAQDNRGTVQAGTARFAAARMLFADGFADLGTTDRHADAVAKLEKSRTLYESLIVDSRSFPILEAEALMGVARVEESLCGTPRADSAGTMIGSLDRAADFYKRLADGHPGTFEAKQAAERLKAIQDNRADLLAFYTQLNQRFTKPKG